MRAIALVVTLLCGLTSLAEANALRVAPILLDVSAPGAATTLNLRNDGDEKLRVQIRIFRWTGTQSEPALEPTADVVVSPPATTLAPGTEYVVRVVRVSKQPIGGEESYRILVDEVPDAVGSKANTVRFAMRYSVPVFFTAAGAAVPNVSWSLAAKGSSVALTASNSGGRRIRVANLKLVDSNGATLVQRPGLVGYALGNSSATWTLPAGEKFARHRGSLRVIAESESGALDAVVALQPSR
jgi:fimbrial chaperone protein